MVDAHAELFAQLFGALLGRDVTFVGSPEKWIVWPAAGEGRDPQEEKLAGHGTRVVELGQGGRYGLRVFG